MPASQLIRVLVVEEDARVQGAITATIALETDLILVGAYADTANALAAAALSRPAVALVNVPRLEKELGLDLIRALSLTSSCAVVAMSARGGLRRAALDAGAVAFVQKSGDIDAMLAAVRHAGGQARR